MGREGEGMKDREIVRLFLRRDEAAIEQVQQAYELYCRSIVSRILRDETDVSECVNDVWLAAWNSIPPNEPERLATYLGKLARNIAIDRVRANGAQKRCAEQYALSLDELAEVISDGGSPEQQAQHRELERAIGEFVRGLPELQRRVFLCRYWYLDSLAEIGARFGYSESKVKSMLHRTREKLKRYLQKEELL